MISKINNDKYDVAVIGLGYVGLTLAATLADIGYHVLGIEKREEVVKLTKSKKAHFYEKGLDDILSRIIDNNRFEVLTNFLKDKSSDIYIITVGTPLDKEGNTRTDYLQNAAKQVADNMNDGALVILRSTVKIGSTRNLVAPILQASGKSFQLAMCPERTIEGSAISDLYTLPQIIGCDDPKTATRAHDFFSTMTNSVIVLHSLEAAEITKLVDNTYRDVSFGFANEVARICDAYGVNANEVINAGKQGYPRTNVALPGLVGGPCLEKDPHILFQSGIEKGIRLEITEAARIVNERQPEESVKIIVDRLHKTNKSSPTITIWGLAFKGIPATNDLRGSMSLKVIEQLRKKLPSAKLIAYDPVCSPEEITELLPNIKVIEDQINSIEHSDCLIIANNHPKLSDLSFIKIAKTLSKEGFVFDYWNHFSQNQLSDLAHQYIALGDGYIGKQQSEI